VTAPTAELRRAAEQHQDNRERDLADRRNRLRFSLRLAVKCRRTGLRFVLDKTSVGESLNISSKGLLFTTSETFLPGQLVEAVIDWPMRLHGGVQLRLVVEGAVLRTARNYTVMRVEKYQFRTGAASRPAQNAAKPAVSRPAQ
jgi:hypothetical protein